MPDDYLIPRKPDYGRPLANWLAASDQGLPAMIDPLAGQRGIGDPPDMQNALKSFVAQGAEPLRQVGAAMRGMAGPPGGMVAKPAAEAIGKAAVGATGRDALSGIVRAYHGSPHDFERFDVSKVGTGEGAQAYGHGLYFAENERVARGYRDELKWKGTDWNDPEYVAGYWLNRFGGDSQKAIDYLAGSVKHRSSDASKVAVSDAIGMLQKGESGKMPSNPGRVYEVAI